MHVWKIDIISVRIKWYLNDNSDTKLKKENNWKSGFLVNMDECENVIEFEEFEALCDAACDNMVKKK